MTYNVIYLALDKKNGRSNKRPFVPVWFAVA